MPSCEFVLDDSNSNIRECRSLLGLTAGKDLEEGGRKILPFLGVSEKHYYSLILTFPKRSIHLFPIYRYSP